MFDFSKYARVDGRDKEAVNKYIKSVILSAGKLKEALHVAIVAGIDHAMLHRDTAPLTRLWNGLGEGVNKRKVKAYIEGTTTLKLDKNKDKVEMWLGRGARNEKVYQWADENNAFIPYYEFEKEPAEPKAYDFIAEVNKLFEKAAKKQEKEEFPVHQLEAFDLLNKAFRATVEANQAVFTNAAKAPQEQAKPELKEAA